MTDKIEAKLVKFTANDVDRFASELKSMHVSMLRYSLKGTPYKHISEELGIKIGTVKSATNRARLAIAEKMKMQEMQCGQSKTQPSM